MKRSPREPMPLGLRLFTSFGLIGEAAPFAPATFASLALVPALYFFIAAPLWIQAVILLATTWAGIIASTRAERYYGHDGSPIVIDEVAGMFMACLAIPVPASGPDRWMALLVAFFLFRVFDILKPFPAGRLQDMSGGKGVMLDDIAAGVYANLGVRLVIAWVGWA